MTFCFTYFTIYNKIIFMKWTKDRCHEESIKYKHRNELKKNNRTVYNKILKNKWFDLFDHMTLIYNGDVFWTKEKCQEEALKYDNLKDFTKHSVSAYRYAKYNFWLDDIITHMNKYGNKLKRCVYVYEFSDKCAYVGLTYNINKRNFNHMNDKKSQVFKHIELSGLIPILIVKCDYIDIELSTLLEGEYIEKYKKDGWYILNKIKSGGIGGNVLIWTKEKCQEESSKYKSRVEFSKKNPSAYSSANKHKWLNDICNHMISKRKPNGYWTKEMCQEEILKYNNLKDFTKYSHGAYKSSLRNKWLNDMKITIKRINK